MNQSHQPDNDSVCFKTLHRLDDEYQQLVQVESFLERNILQRLQDEESCLRNALVIQDGTSKGLATMATTTAVDDHQPATDGPTHSKPPPPATTIATIKATATLPLHKRKLQPSNTQTILRGETEKQKLVRLEQALLLDDDDDDDDETTKSSRSRIQQTKRGRSKGEQDGDDDDDESQDQEKALLDLLSEHSD